ncbi:MAP kinase kinase (MEK) [Lobulomyces angularis]|nr:MAP kinase kinase (MEK) [Lobulomyces angularis]
MEVMDMGSFDSILQKLGKFDEATIAKIAVRVINGLAYLNEVHKIVHRDIKPSNILLNSKGEIKIADFGVSKELVDGTVDGTFTGTMKYMSPECLEMKKRKESRSNFKGDIWSLGKKNYNIAADADGIWTRQISVPKGG